MNRKPGYYWVRRWEGSSRGPWELAEWRKAWWLIGYSTPMSDSEMESIGRYQAMEDPDDTRAQFESECG